MKLFCDFHFSLSLMCCCQASENCSLCRSPTHRWATAMAVREKAKIDCRGGGGLNRPPFSSTCKRTLNGNSFHLVYKKFLPECVANRVCDTQSGWAGVNSPPPIFFPKLYVTRVLLWKVAIKICLCAGCELLARKGLRSRYPVLSNSNTTCC